MGGRRGCESGRVARCLDLETTKQSRAGALALAASGMATPSGATIIKYDNPILISAQGRARAPPKNKLTPTEDILNSILPPREWTEKGQLWVQYVSSAPSTKKDVLMLQSTLDTLLQQRQARETGLCPIREELYSQAFDELIRQVTIMCAERGLLLLRVREEIRMATTAYQTLYESSIAYGMRRALTQEATERDLKARAAQLQNENSMLQIKIEDQQKALKRVISRAENEKIVAEAKQKEDVDLIKKHNASLRAALRETLSVKEEKKEDEKKAKKRSGDDDEDEDEDDDADENEGGDAGAQESKEEAAKKEEKEKQEAQ